MLDNLISEVDQEPASRSELARACEEARRRVAEDPADEQAALLLTAAVKRFARADPREPYRMREVSPPVSEARELIAAGKLEEAEIMLRQHLKTHRHDAAAMHSMAEIAALCDLQED